jgi:MoxR-like ATPase
MARILDELGIYGFSNEDECAIFASLLTGDPLLLIGQQGSAKTALGCSIGAAFKERDRKLHPDNPEKWFNYQAYDCSKMNFEDIVGFPNPADLQKGEVGFVKSPMTAWGKDLIIFDEFNRQTPERQNNVFEMIRSRTLQGIPTDTKYVIACMNPYGMAGTEILDEALVDRMAYYIYVKDFTSLDEIARDYVVHHQGPSDAPALKHWTGIVGEFDVNKDTHNELLAASGETLHDLMQRAAKIYKELNDTVGEAYGTFINKFFACLHNEIKNKDYKVPLTGRRAGLIKRALLAYRSIDIAMCDLYKRRELSSVKDAFAAVLRRTIPIGISTANESGMGQDAWNSIQSNLERYSDFFNASDPGTAINALDTIYELLTTNDIVRKIEIITTEISDNIAKNNVWTEIINSSASTRDLNHSIVIGIVANLMTIDPTIVPENVRKTVGNAYVREMDNLAVISDKIVLKGNGAYFSSAIEKDLAEYTNPFVKLQAKLRWSKLLDTHFTSTKKISESDISKYSYDVKGSCAALTTLLSRYQSVDTTKKLAKEVDDHATSI